MEVLKSCGICLKENCSLTEEAQNVPDELKESSICKHVDKLKLCFPDLTLINVNQLKLCKQCAGLLNFTYILRKKLIAANKVHPKSVHKVNLCSNKTLDPLIQNDRNNKCKTAKSKEKNSLLLNENKLVNVINGDKDKSIEIIPNNRVEANKQLQDFQITENLCAIKKYTLKINETGFHLTSATEEPNNESRCEAFNKLDKKLFEKKDKNILSNSENKDTDSSPPSTIEFYEDSDIKTSEKLFVRENAHFRVVNVLTNKSSNLLCPLKIGSLETEHYKDKSNQYNATSMVQLNHRFNVLEQHIDKEHLEEKKILETPFADKNRNSDKQIIIKKCGSKKTITCNYCSNIFFTMGGLKRHLYYCFKYKSKLCSSTAQILPLVKDSNSPGSYNSNSENIPAVINNDTKSQTNSLKRISIMARRVLPNKNVERIHYEIYYVAGDVHGNLFDFEKVEKINTKDNESEFNTSTINEHSYAMPKNRTMLLVVYRCNYCQLINTNKFDLIDHLKTHTDDVIFPFRCEFCLDRFEEQDEFDKHLEKVHEKQLMVSSLSLLPQTANVEKFKSIQNAKNFEQEFIETNFAFSEDETESGLISIKHFKQLIKYRCRICLKYFDTKPDLRNHMQKIHSNKNVSLLISKYNNYKIVAPKVKVPSNLKCTYCAKIFKNKSMLAMHERIHTGEKPYHCNLCGKNFNQRAHLNYHVDHHPDGKVHKCEICDRKFANRGVLMRHNIEMHGNTVGKFQCHYCGKFYDLEKHLRRHIKHTHEAPFDETFKCRFCDKTFNLKTNLKVHEFTKHTGQKKHKCPDCSKMFIMKHQLIQHRYTHTGEKPFKCLQCPKSFRKSSNLYDHQRSHSGERPFQCRYEECSSKFMSHSVRRRHELRVHESREKGSKIKNGLFAFLLGDNGR